MEDFVIDGFATITEEMTKEFKKIASVFNDKIESNEELYTKVLERLEQINDVKSLEQNFNNLEKAIKGIKLEQDLDLTAVIQAIKDNKVEIPPQDQEAVLKGIQELRKAIEGVKVKQSPSEYTPVRRVRQVGNGFVYDDDFYGGGGSRGGGISQDMLVDSLEDANLKIKATDSPSIDAFGRWRTSEPITLFDSKQIFDNQPLFWDDQEVSGSGTGSNHSTAEARTRISVSDTTAGKRVRQTFQSFNYQSGKSQLILMTTRASRGDATGITMEVGYGNDDNGLFFQIDDGVMYVVRRTKTSGSVVDNRVAQSNFNLDTMDGNGASGVTIDPSKTQIMIIDFEWLGVGRVRMGFVVDGIIYYCHEFLNANNLETVYMSTPNLPIRYSIENDGTGPAVYLDHICSSVMSEGGQENNGILRHKDSGSVSSLSTGTVYALLGIRLKSGYIGADVLMENISMIATSTNDQLHWELRLNPTVAGTFTYSDETNSAVQVATGASTNTVTGGTEIDGGYLSTAIPVSPSAPNARKLGANIAGTVDTIVLCVRPITNNITVQASFTWRELS